MRLLNRKQSKYKSKFLEWYKTNSLSRLFYSTELLRGQRSWRQVKKRWIGALKMRLLNRKQSKYKSKFLEWYKTALVTGKFQKMSC